MDKGDIVKFYRANIDPAVIVNLARESRIVLSEGEVDELRKSGIPDSILLALKDQPSAPPTATIVTSAEWTPERNFILTNIGSHGFFVDVSLEKREIIASDRGGTTLVEPGHSLELILSSNEFKVIWAGTGEKLTANIKNREVTIVSIDSRPDFVYGVVYRNGKERDTEYLYQKPQPVVVQAPAPVIVRSPEPVIVQLPPRVIYQPEPEVIYVTRQPVYVTPEPVYVYREPVYYVRPQPSSLYLNFSFGSSRNLSDRHHQYHH